MYLNKSTFAPGTSPRIGFYTKCDALWLEFTIKMMKNVFGNSDNVVQQMFIDKKCPNG